jgi:hypothetical protein
MPKSPLQEASQVVGGERRSHDPAVVDHAFEQLALALLEGHDLLLDGPLT